MKGVTFYVCIGKFAKPQITLGRICLGWVSIAVVLIDLEIVIDLMLKKLNQQATKTVTYEAEI